MGVTKARARLSTKLAFVSIHSSSSFKAFSPETNEQTLYSNANPGYWYTNEYYELNSLDMNSSIAF